MACSAAPIVIEVEPLVTVKVATPVTNPGLVGVNVAGTVSVAPLASDFGSPDGDTLNGAVADAAVMVTAAFAVNLIVPEPELPTLTLPKLVCGTDSSGVAGAPKPIRLPSRVPT